MIQAAYQSSFSNLKKKGFTYKYVDVFLDNQAKYRITKLIFVIIWPVHTKFNLQPVTNLINVQTVMIQHLCEIS